MFSHQVKTNVELLIMSVSHHCVWQLAVTLMIKLVHVVPSLSLDCLGTVQTVLPSDHPVGAA